MSTTTDVAIIGAGPYGLSIAAHLKANGIDHHIIGNPMHTWREKMPEGMSLKSAGFASNLYEPARSFTLENYCKSVGLPYRHVDMPVQLRTFCDYGMEFQRRFVPDLENEVVTHLAMEPGAFHLELGNGATLSARRVVVATGISHFQYIPEEICGMPPELLSHSGDHRDLTKFRCSDVIVLGAGSSAVDTAVLLHETGARVQQIIRNTRIEFGGARERYHGPLLHRIKSPLSKIGPGWKNQICVSLPWLFRYLPDATRNRIVRNRLGPSGGWFMKERAALVPILVNKKVEKAEAVGNRVRLHLKNPDGGTTSLDADRVIAATGYRVNLRMLSFLPTDMVQQIALVEGSPALSANFESSINGLYFVGTSAAMTFGPLMRFAVGADFTSRRLSKHLSKT